MKVFFQREGSLYIACNDKNAFFTSDAVRNYNLWSCQKVCEAHTFLLDLDNIYIRFGSKLYRHIVGIPMGTNCAPLVADLFLFCYERDFMLSLSEDNQSDVIEPGRVAQSVGHRTRKSGVLGSIPGLATYFRFSFRFF